MNTIYFLCNSRLHIFKLGKVIILCLLYFNFRWMKKRIPGMLKIFKNFHFWTVLSVILKLKQKQYSKIMQLKIIPNPGCKTFQPRTFQPQYSTRDFQPQYLSPDFSTPIFNPGLFNHELFNHGLFNQCGHKVLGFKPGLFNPRFFNHELF